MATSPKSLMLPPLDVQQRYTPEETAAYLRTSRKTVFDLIKDGRIRSIKEGRRRFCPGSEIARLSAAPAA
jgi:excisionase family DNA binding protein